MAPEIEEIDGLLEEAEKAADQGEIDRRLMSAIIGGLVGQHG